jgi:hypothetical protein
LSPWAVIVIAAAAVVTLALNLHEIVGLQPEQDTSSDSGGAEQEDDGRALGDDNSTEMGDIDNGEGEVSPHGEIATEDVDLNPQFDLAAELGLSEIDPEPVLVAHVTTLSHSWGDSSGGRPNFEPSIELVGTDDPAELSATWWLAWDSDYLYVHAEIRDNAFETAHVSWPPHVWRGDSIHFELGEDPTCVNDGGGLRELDRHYLISAVEGSPNTLVSAANLPKFAEDGHYFSDYSFVSVEESSVADGVASKSPDGYWISGKVPFVPGLLREAEGHILGGNFNVSDAGMIPETPRLLSSNWRRLDQESDEHDNDHDINADRGRWGFVVLMPAVEGSESIGRGCRQR